MSESRHPRFDIYLSIIHSFIEFMVVVASGRGVDGQGVIVSGLASSQPASQQLVGHGR